VAACPTCGEQNSERARFCQNCGASLAIAEGAREERKLVSVLFVDLVGFTSRSDQADPEDVRDVLTAYQARVRERIEEHGGLVEKFIGDAVMAVFGAPLSHGDDAERAVRAGLSALETIEQLNREQPGLGLTVRAAVNTGVAVVRVGSPTSSGEPLATGDVVNTTARLQGAAPAGTLIVGGETYRATRDAIRYAELAPIEAKGKRELLHAWQAIAVARAPGERRASGAPMAGRGRELNMLEAIWSSVVQERRPHLVTVIGPPGIGKSRLASEFANAVRAKGGRAFRGRCMPYAERAIYAAFGQQVRQVAGIFDDDAPDLARQKLDLLLSSHLPEPEAAEMMRYLPLLVGIGGAEGVDNRLQLFFAARRLVERLGQEHPTLLVFEDIHWADTGELDLLEYFASHLKETPVILLALTRQELLDSRPSWGGGLGPQTKIALDPLSREDALTLAAHFLTDEAQLSHVTGVAEGNPLFIEELAAALSEAGPRASGVPTSVKEAIAANIDSLAPGPRAALLDASVVGKTFWRDVLGGVSAVEPLDPALEELEARDLVRREADSRLAGDAQFVFKHALVHEVAYATLPRAARRQRHAKVAELLERRLGAGTSEMAGILGHHWREAGQPARALEYLLTAADTARKAWAKEEAVRLYDEAIALLSESDRPGRARLRALRGRALVDLGDYARGGEDLDAVIGDLEGRDQLEAVLSRARAAFWLEETEQVAALGDSATELAEGLGAREMLGPALSFVAVGLSTRGDEGDVDRAIAVGNRALEVWVPGTRQVDLAVHKNYHAMLHYWTGQYHVAATLAQSAHELGGDYESMEALFRGGGEQALALVAMGRHAEGILLVQSLLARAQVMGRRWGAFVRTIWSMALRDFGLLDEARRLNQEAIELTESVGATFGTTQSMIDLLVIDLARGDVGRAQEALPGVRQRVDESKTWFRWLVNGRLLVVESDLALAVDDPEQGVERSHLAISAAVRSKRPKYEGLARLTLGQSLLRLGRPADAIAELSPAVAITDRLESPPARWRARAMLGRALYGVGEDSRAAAAYGEAAQLIRDFAATIAPDHAAALLGSEGVRAVLKGRPYP
jgi:class 3 adenylate cyclase/tetratricopeptide (TPR) repeat protein